MNDLQRYFESNDRRLIHKWMHYFEIYDRYFSRFRGTDVHIVEIGIYHGGSLQMWRDYFGPNAKIIGIDIDPRCKQFEEEGIEIIIGDQEDRTFLADLREKFPRIDILLDGGGHTMRQQIVTFEELFSHVSENGIYLCEDLHTSYWGEYGGGFRQSDSFIEYSKRLVDLLNAWHSRDPDNFRVTDFTRSVYSIDYYDSIIVIEKRPISAPQDRVTGNPSFEEDQILKLQDKISNGKILEYQKDLVPASLQSLVAELNLKILQLEDALQTSQLKLLRADTELQHLRAESQQMKVELEDLQEQLTDTEARLEACQDQAKLKLTIAETEFQIDRTEKLEKLERAQSRITAMESSKFWQIRNSWLKLKGRLRSSQEDIAPFVIFDLNPPPPQLPPTEAKTDQQLLEEKIVKVEQQTTSPTELYERWIECNTPKSEDFKRMAEIMAVLRERPLISIIMPVYNTPEEYLREAIDSVIGQLYPNWELCIADDASTELHVRKVLEKYARKDSRIKIAFREENGHISRCSNSAVELATGDYIALLDQNDVLPVEALFEVVFLINQYPDADMIYSDEDKLTVDGKRRDPYFKPDWCPDSFLSRMYTGHFGVYRRSIINEIGGFRVGYEGSQDYDLVLRFTEKTDKIYHIPKILYHGRIYPEAAASVTSTKPNAYIAAEKAITDAIHRRGEPGKVSSKEQYPGIYTIRYEISDYKLVSIIIPTKDLGYILNQCIESIFAKTTYPNYEVIVIDNGSNEAYTAKVISNWLNQQPERFKCYSLDVPFNYSKINNYGVEKAKGDFLLFLNNDTEVIVPDWIEGMVEQSQRPSIGAVGATLLYSDGTIQHSGITMGVGSLTEHGHRHFASDSPGFLGQLLAVNNYTAVTGACLMCRREVFEAVGGFNEQLAVGYNDIDLCLKMMAQGYHNVLPPHVVLYHYESKSRGFDNTPEKRARFLEETHYIQKRWKSIIEHDPCYSPNLTLRYTDFSIRERIDPQEQIISELSRQLIQIEIEKEEAIGRVKAMESSKLWKLRSQWFWYKKTLKLPSNE